MSEDTTTTADGTLSGDNSAEEIRAARKVREGMVTSTNMDKTIVVTVTDRVRHAKYNKFVLRSKKLYTHDETNDAGVGDRVRVMETRPMSKSKRWRLVEIVERAR
jgi:small subunit ribosomal protein S17